LLPFFGAAFFGSAALTGAAYYLGTTLGAS